MSKIIDLKDIPAEIFKELFFYETWSNDGTPNSVSFKNYGKLDSKEPKKDYVTRVLDYHEIIERDVKFDTEPLIAFIGNPEKAKNVIGLHDIGKAFVFVANSDCLKTRVLEIYAIKARETSNNVR